MKITFYSNFLNHHQLPFCLEMINKIGNNFVFVATEKTPKDRIQLGYEDMNAKYDFVLEEYKNSKNKKRAELLTRTSDIVIWGSAPYYYMKESVKGKALVYRYSERILKEGLIKAFNPFRYIKNFYKFNIIERNAFLLSASGYATLDYNIFLGYRDRSFKWGYFPEVKKVDIKKILSLKKNNKKIRILWVGRLIDWKHPESVISLATRLKRKNLDFIIEIIGEGPMKDELIEKIEKEDLIEYINLLGSMPHDSVRSYMEKSNIFLFTSDFNEGWGAVLNEAMNSGCAVVSSHAIGSVPFLIKNNENGIIYKNGDEDDLYKKVKFLINNKEIRHKMGLNAYETLDDTWNAKEAVERFLNVSEALLKKDNYIYNEGPMSKSYIITQNMRKRGKE